MSSSYDPKPAPGAPQWAIKLCQDIVHWVEARSGGPQRLKAYTVAQALALPAADYLNYQIIVSNESGGRTIATSDGTNWRRVRDGAVIT